jgi:hypothetical protein
LLSKQGGETIVYRIEDYVIVQIPFEGTLSIVIFRAFFCNGKIP